MGNLELIVEKHSERIHRGLEVLPTLRYGLPAGLGNKRWTGDLILATYEEALTGELPKNGLEYKTGHSGGFAGGVSGRDSGEGGLPVEAAEDRCGVGGAAACESDGCVA